MSEVDSDELAPLNHHTVKKGETLLSISKKLKVSRTDLAEANYLSTKASLKAGQQLIIPRAADPPARCQNRRNGTDGRCHVSCECGARGREHHRSLQP